MGCTSRARRGRFGAGRGLGGCSGGSSPGFFDGHVPLLSCDSPRPRGVSVTALARRIIVVFRSDSTRPPQGEAIAGACRRLGFREVLAIRQGKRFEVELSDAGDAAETRVAELAAELLANPVIEEFAVRRA